MAASPSSAPRAYRAVLCDLLTALVDSWALWADVAGDADLGRRWREASLRLVTGQGAYRPYEELLARATREVGLPPERADALLARWGELAPYPDVAPALRAARARGLALAVVTNCSQRLAEQAAANVPVAWDAVVSAERAGVYKPEPRAYLAGCAALGVPPAEALFVAGSPHDVPGAAGAGLAVLWVNRRHLPPPAGAQPLAIAPTLAALEPLLGLPHAEGAT